MFSKTEYVLQCQRGIKVQFSAAAIRENTSNFIQEFPEVFPYQKPTILPPLQDMNHTITLLETKMDSNPQILTVPDKYIPKLEEAITK
jgi:hypothetical protein